MFGGRGFSILDPVDMTRVYDSGDDFERYFTTPSATAAEQAIFNGAIGSNSQPQSANVDRRSPELVGIATLQSGSLLYDYKAW